MPEEMQDPGMIDKVPGNHEGVKFNPPVREVIPLSNTGGSEVATGFDAAKAGEDEAARLDTARQQRADAVQPLEPDAITEVPGFTNAAEGDPTAQ